MCAAEHDVGDLDRSVPYQEKGRCLVTAETRVPSPQSLQGRFASDTVIAFDNTLTVWGEKKKIQIPPPSFGQVVLLSAYLVLLLFL